MCSLTQERLRKPPRTTSRTKHNARLQLAAPHRVHHPTHCPHAILANSINFPDFHLQHGNRHANGHGRQHKLQPRTWYRIYMMTDTTCTSANAQRIQ